MAILIMCEAKKGISANQMKRTLGVAHKTAWYLCHRIRKAMTEVSPAPLCGTVECDETYVGGKRPGFGRGYRRNKAMVLAALERTRRGERVTAARPVVDGPRQHEVDQRRGLFPQRRAVRAGKAVTR